MSFRLINIVVLAGLLSFTGCGQHPGTDGFQAPKKDGPGGGDPGGGGPGGGGPGGGGPGGGGPGGRDDDTLSNSPSGTRNPSKGEGAPEPVPEPATIFLFGSGITGLAIIRRRRKAKSEES